jgi:hypothetical protein
MRAQMGFRQIMDCDRLKGTEQDLNTHLDRFGREPPQWLVIAVINTYKRTDLDNCYPEDACLVIEKEWRLGSFAQKKISKTQILLRVLLRKL